MIDRKISRVALLQDYTGYPEKLLSELEEVAGKGYDTVCFYARIEEMDVFRKLCEKASSMGLSVSAFTAYMKYQEKYLSEHPEQRLVSAREMKDQDGLSTSSWGCPFNADFKERYFNFLREVAVCPGIIRIWLNDEASLPGSGCHCRNCRQAYSMDIGAEMPLVVEPEAGDWQDIKWRNYLKWNIGRWNAIHAEMVQVVHKINPEIKAIFQASPASDIWHNPWKSCVDLAGMAKQLDGLCTDPYYTFHKAPFFTPAETYLSEWSRFLVGMVPADGVVEIVPQGFSFSTFTRPLGVEDGLWSAIIPPACGVNIITPYTYTLQRCSPVQEAYESCFKMDRYFEKVFPLKYAAIVHGAGTEIYLRPIPADVPDSYDGVRVLPLAQALRHRGIPYGYLPDICLSDDAALSDYRVVILPEVDCLSSAMEDGIRRFNASNGNIVILGQLGIADETGSRHGRSLLEGLSGIRVLAETGDTRRFRIKDDYRKIDAFQHIDEDIVEKYSGGVYRPLYTLNCCVDAEVPSDAEIIAEFVDEYSVPTGNPAIVSLKCGGNILWFAGFPSHISFNGRYGLPVRNLSHLLFAALIEDVAGVLPSLRVEGWPPDVPMKNIWPLSHYHMSTFEFFPLSGEDHFIGVVASYFKEPTSFPMVLDLPPGRDLIEVKELISNRSIPFEKSDGKVRVQVDMKFDTPVVVMLFCLSHRC
ncbi:MAG: hypothetical protein PHT33_01075 [bacterium]|nr:hypothetical protein [bacterium]